MLNQCERFQNKYENKYGKYGKCCGENNVLRRKFGITAHLLGHGI